MSCTSSRNEKEFNIDIENLSQHNNMNNISESEKTEFENYLFTHPDKQKEVELFNKTKLQPYKSLVFSKKKKLL